MKISKHQLREIISEELGATRHGPYRARWESLNPEWDKANKIKSALVYLADDLEKSQHEDAPQLAQAIVEDLLNAVAAMEARLNETFGE